MELLIIYLLIINAVGFILMLVDKYKAIKNLWRIPEKTLLLVAAVGGSVGSLLGMYVAHHKTKHPKFLLGIPAMMFAHFIIACIIVNW